MSTGTDQTTGSLEAYDAQNSPEGLFARYCRGRLKSVRERHLVTVLGSGALLTFTHPLVGIAVFVLALAGDLFDCAVLRWLVRRYPDGAAPPFLRKLTTWTAAAQATSVAISVLVVWIWADVGDARFFSVAYLFGSALTAGLTLVHNPAATGARMAVYFGTAAGLMGHDLITGVGTSMRFGFDVVAVGIFGYMVWVYVRVTATGLRHRIAYQRALLIEKLQVEEAGRAARASEEQARLLALVAEHANDGVVITDKHGRVEYVNETFQRMSGLSADEMTGSESWNLLVGPETSRDTFEKIAVAMATSQPLRTDVLSYPKSGGKLWVELSLTPIFDENGEFSRYINVGRDVSEAKRREEELSRAKVAAEEGSRAKSSFLATMSHEIRTPMNAIIGMANLLSETRLDTTQKTYVSTVTEASEALLTIIGDILEATRLETGKVDLVDEPFDLHGCIRGVARLLEATANDKGLSLEVAIADECPEWVRGDGGRVRQILLNLVGNAIKFTESGFVSMRADAKAGSDCVLLVVQDSGIGIRENRLSQIFETFAQEDGHTTRRFGGTGLGLSISRMLVQAMGGEIGVQSSLGEGSTFTVGLDLPREAVAPTAVAETTPDPKALRGKRILIAEDNRANRLLISKLLASTGAHIRFAEDGLEAIAGYHEFQPEAILMDMSMPRMDGLAATREIVAMQSCGGSPCPIIALTANAFTEDREQCLAAGMTAFLSKPVRKQMLLACLAKAIAEAHLDRSDGSERRSA